MFQISIYLILTLYLTSSEAYAFQFNDQGEFTILQLTDQHYCESNLNDRDTQTLTRALLNAVQPDLVVFTGDQVSGYGGSDDAGFFQSCWERFTLPVNEAGIPYAYLLGNHDDEGNLNREQIVQLDLRNPLSIRGSYEGIPDKATFYVPIYSSNNQSQLAANLWMFDSGGYGCNGYSGSWGCIEIDQLDWYDEESKKLKEQYGENVHHIAFFHIPIPEYLQVYNYKEIYGAADEYVYCSYINTGLFERVIKNRDITGMFVGHDHLNDFGGWYEGVELVYGRKSGYGGYGELRGARVIKLKEKVNETGNLTITRDHYVVYENGSIGQTEPAMFRQGFKQAHCVMLYSPKSYAVLGMFQILFIFVFLF